MIEITVFRNADGAIARVHVEGHAFFSSAGQDIVCAAVSILTINTINSCEKLLGIELPARSSDGLIDCRLPLDLPDSSKHDLQLLFESMILGLEDIREQYPKHVRLLEKPSKY